MIDADRAGDRKIIRVLERVTDTFQAPGQPMPMHTAEEAAEINLAIPRIPAVTLERCNMTTLSQVKEIFRRSPMLPHFFHLTPGWAYEVTALDIRPLSIW